MYSRCEEVMDEDVQDCVLELECFEVAGMCMRGLKGGGNLVV